jgi:hypothetical protein
MARAGPMVLYERCIDLCAGFVLDLFFQLFYFVPVV